MAYRIALLWHISTLHFLCAVRINEIGLQPKAEPARF
jgi:hypothetical protein